MTFSWHDFQQFSVESNSSCGPWTGAKLKGIGVDYGLSEIQMRERGRVGSYYQRIENENEKIIGKIKVFF